jgi:hypothetical protein
MWIARKQVENSAKIIGIVVLVFGLMVTNRILEFGGLGLLIVAAAMSITARRSRRAR